MVQFSGRDGDDADKLNAAGYVLGEVATHERPWMLTVTRR